MAGQGVKTAPISPVSEKQTESITLAASRLGLTERQVYILTLRADGLELAQIGEHMQVSSERIRQIERKALAKILFYLISASKRGLITPEELDAIHPSQGSIESMATLRKNEAFMAWFRTELRGGEPADPKKDFGNEVRG